MGMTSNYTGFSLILSPDISIALLLIREQTRNKQGKNKKNLGGFSEESSPLEHFIAGTPLEFAGIGLDRKIGWMVIAMINGRTPHVYFKQPQPDFS